jgi:hypothetical protein
MIKEWKDVQDYELMYAISSDGEVKSKARVVRTKGGGLRPVREKFNSIRYDKDGYRITHLSKEGKVKTMKIHRLVASAFIPNSTHKPQVNHIDGNKSNNTVTNLEWVTGAENQTHAQKNGYFEVSNSKKRKRVMQLTMGGEVVKIWDSASSCGGHGFTRVGVRDCCLGKQKSHYGFLWLFDV